jgi:hypothetical protein
MKKENMKIIAIVISAILLIASIMFAIIIYTPVEHNKPEEPSGGESTYTGKFWRDYDLILNSSGNYTVFLPLVLDNSGISFIMDNLTLKEGNASFEIVNSTYGPALKVNGSGKIMIKSEVCVKGTWSKKKHELVSANVSGNPINVTNLVITLSMTEFRDYLWDSKNNTSVEKVYNTTDSHFRDSELWKYYIDEPYIYMPTDGVELHSFVYISSEKPINISLELSESLMSYPTWSLSGTFTENGWHYVKLDIEEGPTDI